MNRTLIAIVALMWTLASPSAFAMYSPILGSFINRDPGVERDRDGRPKVPSPIGVQSGRMLQRTTPVRPYGGVGYQNGLSLYRAYFVPTATDPWGLTDYPVDCGTVTVNINNGASPPEISLFFTKDPNKHCCCKAFGFSQEVSNGANGPWRFDNGAYNGLPEMGKGASSNPDPTSGNQPGENDRPSAPAPPPAQSPWPGNPWYGGGNANGQNKGGPPTPANPNPSSTNPNPSDSIADAPSYNRGLYFIDQLLCQDTGKIVWSYAWNNVDTSNEGSPGSITGAPWSAP